MSTSTTYAARTTLVCLVVGGGGRENYTKEEELGVVRKKCSYKWATVCHKPQYLMFGTNANKRGQKLAKVRQIRTATKEPLVIL